MLHLRCARPNTPIQTSRRRVGLASNATLLLVEEESRRDNQEAGLMSAKGQGSLLVLVSIIQCSHQYSIRRASVAATYPQLHTHHADVKLRASHQTSIIMYINNYTTQPSSTQTGHWTLELSTNLHEVSHCLEKFPTGAISLMKVPTCANRMKYLFRYYAK